MGKNQKNNLKEFLPGTKEGVELKELTSFKIGGKAKYFFIAKKKEDLVTAVSAAKETKTPFFIIGGASKILVSDKGFSGLVIKDETFGSEIKKISDTEISVGSGLPLSFLSEYLISNSLSGFEWAFSIPGTVGGAVANNSGAFKNSMQDNVLEVEVFEAEEEKTKIFRSKDCGFEYRGSIFKKNKDLIILSVKLKFQKGSDQEIKNKTKEILELRARNQPLYLPSVGSIFKNPENISAGKLIEDCGLLGKTMGGAKISEIHGNFILNCNNASSDDVKKLILLAKREVKKKFGVNLEEEIQILE